MTSSLLANDKWQRKFVPREKHEYKISRDIRKISTKFNTFFHLSPFYQNFAELWHVYLDNGRVNDE
jgi:hypothetical protein